MGRQNRRSSVDLKLDLLKEGHAYSFFQVMRLLRLYDLPSDPNEARTFGTEDDKIRIRPKLSLAFPPADVDMIEESDDEETRFRVTATFLGLYGTSSPLPTFYTAEELMEEEREDESVARDFLDIINNRLFFLLFGCWSKYRQFVQVVEERKPDYLERLFCLVGLGEKVLRSDLPESYRLLHYIGLLSQFPRSSAGLRTLLWDALEKVPVEIIPCVPRKAIIPQDQRSRLGTTNSDLGINSYLGKEIRDRMSKFRVRVGPLTKEQFYRFLPGGDKHRMLVFMTDFYIIEPLEYDLELILSKGHVQTACLGGSEWSRLGMDTWVFCGGKQGEFRTTFCPKRDRRL